MKNQCEKPRWRLAVPIVAGVFCAFCNWIFLMEIVRKSAEYYSAFHEIMTFKDRQVLAQDMVYAGLVNAGVALFLIYPLSRWAMPTTRNAVFLSVCLMTVFFAGIAWSVWSAFTVKP